jgi:methylenetetrahydrofolate dehydrogenase (NADP+)/methenyltetrahydrofolate cyclohydrolase
MSAQIIDGKALALRLRRDIAARAAALAAAGRRPGLAVVLVGDDPASQVYVRSKVKACDEAGFASRELRLSAAISQTELHARIDELNADASMHGILLQLPLPRGLDATAAIARIAPHKDVDGLHAASAGALVQGKPGFRPCTPYGCMRMLESIGLDDLRGRHAVVLGRSILVGKPMALLLLEANATVTVCHSGTADLAAHTRQADILVAAIGKPKFVGAEMVKPGAVVIDVGINRGADGKLVGDVDYDAVAPRAGWITPVPGGVGPMTIAMLLANTLQACEQAA